MARYGVKKTLGKLIRTGLLRMRSGPKPIKGLVPRSLPELPMGKREGRWTGHWLRVPGSDCSWPLVHYRYISYRRSCGDLRSLWEASRFRWARPEDFPGAFESWIRANPVGLGPNWASSLEVAVRVINWVFLHNKVAANMSRHNNALVLAWIKAHAQHLANNPEPNPPNHALGRALGLFVAGGYLGDRAMSNAGAQAFIKAFEDQFLPDGSHSEGAVGYGLFALEMALIFVLLARHWNFDPGAVELHLGRCLDAAAALWHPDLSFPVIGDFDNGGVLRPITQGYPDYIISLARLLGLQARPRPAQRILRGLGLGVLSGQDLHVITRLFDDPRLPGGHRHSDIGSLVLWWQGAVFVDPGVFLYTGPRAMRTEFRSEIWHNTPRVSQKSMHLLDPDKPFTLLGRAENPFDTIENGFSLEHHLFGAKLRRQLVFERNCLRITDEFSGHDAWVSAFTLAPELEPEITPRGIFLQDKNRRFSMKVSNSRAVRVSGARFCPVYGTTLQTKRIVVFPRDHVLEMTLELT